MKTLTGAEKRQKARKRHSKEYCLQHASRKRLTPADLFHFAVAEKLKIIYCVTPKVVSKTLVRVLEQALGDPGPYKKRWSLFKRL